MGTPGGLDIQVYVNLDAPTGATLEDIADLLGHATGVTFLIASEVDPDTPASGSWSNMTWPAILQAILDDNELDVSVQAGGEWLIESQG